MDITCELVNGQEVYTLPAGSFALGAMVYTKRTPRVTFNIVEADGSTVVIPCEWSAEKGRYSEVSA